MLLPLLRGKKLNVHSRHLCTHGLIVIGLSLVALAGGCGAMNGLPLSPVAGRPAAGEEAVVVLLRWDGGEAPLYPGRTFDPIDLAAFDTNHDSTLADHRAGFKELVRSRVEEILNTLNVHAVRVVNDDAGDLAVETTVCLSHDLSPDGRMEIGRGKYDPCNDHTDDSAVIFGEQIRRLGNGYSLAEWVTVFGNVCAHETAHTFGFGHVARAERRDAGRSAFVELMLDAHTMAEMRRPQRLLSDMTPCTQDATLASGEAAASRPAGR